MGDRQRNMKLNCLYLSNKSALVLVCTYWRNGLRGLKDRLVDLSLRGRLRVRGRLDGAAISLEVETWWRKRHVTVNVCLLLIFSLLYKKIAFQNRQINTTCYPLVENCCIALLHKTECSGYFDMLE